MDTQDLPLPRTRRVPHREAMARMTAAEGRWLARLADHADPTTFRHRSTRHLRETMASLYTHRAPEPGESWRAPVETERRLLLHAEALVALGEDALDMVGHGVPDPDLPDPGTVFATVFAWLHADEPPWAQRAVALLKALGPRAPSERSAAIEGLALGPCPAAVDAVMPLLDEADPRLRAAAVRILGYRGHLPMTSWTQALEDEDAHVRLAAIQAPLAGYDLLEVLHHLAQLDPSEHLAWQRQLRLAALGHAGGLPQARKVLAQEPGHPAALGIVGGAGEAGDARLLMKCVMQTGRAEGLAALAQLGQVEALPWLIGLARRVDVPQDRAALALQAATAIVGALDTGSQASELETWWHDNHARFEAGRRYHHGHADDTQGLLKSLREPQATRALRLRLYDRLAGRLRLQLPRFHSYDFIGTQQRDLDRIASALHALRPGGAIHA